MIELSKLLLQVPDERRRIVHVAKRVKGSRNSRDAEGEGVDVDWHGRARRRWEGGLPMSLACS